MSGPLDTIEWRPESQSRPDAPQADTRPEPGMWETLSGGFRSARADTAGYDEGAELDAYKPVLTALDELGYRSSAFINPARGTVSTGDVWRAVLAEKRKGKLGELPATEAEFDKQWRTKNRETIAAAGEVAARGNPVVAFAGGMAGAMTDPVNLYTLPIGGGGATIWRKVATEALANMAIEAAQTPLINAQRGRQGREAMTPGEIGLNMLFAGAGAAAIRGGIEIAPKVDAAGVRALAPVREWIDGKFADRDLANAFGQSVPAHLRTPDEAAAFHVATRQFEIDDASPFQRTYAGIDANAAKLTEAMDALEAGRLVPDRPASAFAPASEAAKPEAAARSSGKLHGGIVGYLRQAGLPDHLARGIAAGIEAESRSSHTIVNPTSGAFGIGQWLGPRKKALFERYGKTPSLAQQLEFLVWELRGGDHGGKSVLGAGDEADALRRYIVDFMRPAAGTETTGDLSRGMAALGRGEEALPVGGGEGRVADGGSGEVDIALVAEAADVDARRAALDDDPLTPQGPQLRRDGFASESAYRIAQAESDAAFGGTDPADDLLYRLRQVVVDRAGSGERGRRSLNRADELAEELGTTPEALREGLDRLAELGEIQRRKDGRFGRLPTGLGRGERTLVEWISDRGGIEDQGGEVGHMGGATWHRGAVGRGKLIRPAREKGGMFGPGEARENTPEALFEAAIADGYFPELDGRLAGDTDIAAAKPDLATFYAAIARELGGDPVRSALYAPQDPRLAGQRGVRSARDRFQSDEHYDHDRARYNAAAQRVFGRDLTEDEFLEAWDGSSPLPEAETGGAYFGEEGIGLEPDLIAMAHRRLDEALDEAWIEAEDDFYDLQAWDLEHAARVQGDAGREGGGGSGAVEGDAGEGGAGRGARQGDAQDDELGAAADRADEFGLRGDPAPDAATARAFDDDAGDGARMAAESVWHDIRLEAGATKEAPIVRFRREAAAIEQDLPPVADGFSRLWRGERQGDTGRGLNYTNDLPGIALPFREGYGGELVYLDVPTADLARYEMTGAAAPGAEFHVPADLASRAKVVDRGKLDTGAATDPAIAARQAEEARLRAAAPLRGENATGQAQDGEMGLGLFDAADQPKFDLDDGLGPRTAAEIRAALDAEQAGLEAIRSCLI